METFPCKPRVLIVDDAAENIQKLTEILLGDCLPMSATNGVQALKLANDDPGPDVILLDIVMPGMNGYEVCTRLKSDLKTKDIPVIFVAELSEKHEARKGLEMGGADYITRPFNQHLVQARIRHQLEIRRFRTLQEAELEQRDASQPAPVSFDLQQELAERKRAQEELCHLNKELEQRLSQCLAQLSVEHEERRLESQRRVADQLEVGLLNATLAQQKRDFDVVGQELESLSFSISHDLRAPLRHLLGFSGALLEDYGDKLDQSAQSFLGCITKSAHKMEAQIEALLGLSRVARQQLTLADVDLSCMVRECAAALQGSEPGRLVDFVIKDHLKARVDATLLRVAIEHLLGNAWKFTKGRETAIIEFGQKFEGDTEVLFVRDNGAGFEMRYADRLFGAFQRMHKESEFEGTGIGLATTQRIIRRHGGSIWAEAAVDGGATFYFTLPG